MEDRHALFGDAKATARAGDVGRKQKLFERAKALFEESPTPANQLALAGAYFDLGKYQESERLLSGLLARHGADIQVLTDLAFAYKNMGKLELAKSTFQKVIAIDSRHALARCAENEIWSLDPSFKPSWLKR